MFNNDRYITNGIKETIPFIIQNLLWLAVDSMQVESKDYLQVFELTAKDCVLKIVHTQEHPPYKHEYAFDTEGVFSAKIFVIDDETHTTMLLAEEY